MSKHLPECPQFCDGKPPKCRGGDCTLCDEVDCICDALRACEQRMLDDDVLAAAYHGQKGYAAGVQAAREAVDGYLAKGTCPDCSFTSRDSDILAAIDALLDTP